MAASANEGAVSLRHWVGIGSEHVTSFRSARMEPWRLVVAALLVLAVSLALSPLDGVLATAVVPMVLLIVVGLCTYIADWVGGATGTTISLVCLDVFFLGGTPAIDAFRNSTSAIILLSFGLISAVVVATIEHLKYDRANARIEAASLRAANTALSAVEIAAAQRPPGDREAYVNVLSTILTAMARVNRASAGALYMLDPSHSVLIRAAAYGGDEPIEDSRDLPAFDVEVGEGFAGRVALERRPITVYDTLADEDVADILDANPHIRSVVGVPLVDPNDKLVGVAWVGLYVPYRFAMTAIARMQALANRTIAFMEAARVADDQDELLDRVQDHYRRLQSVIQTIPEAVMVARPTRGTIVASNAAAQRMFGVRIDGPSDFRRADRLNVVSASGGEIENPIMRAMREGVIVTGVELVVRQPDGEMIPVVASAAPVRADDGTIDAVVGIFQDVAPLKEAERLRDEFISVVSHELRSPLTPIRGFAQVVSRELHREGGHEQQVVWLNTLQQHVDRMTRLVDDLLDVSRLRAGRLKILRAPADLVDICQSVADSWNATATRHDVTFESPENEVIAMVDADRIHQVLDNLVGNAVKYADSGPVLVSLKRGSRADGRMSAQISVSDSGPGISAIDRDAVFTAFYRARNAAESAVPGLGLGLFISNELVVEHDGNLTVSESHLGGSSFTIELPLSDQQARP
jgi:PAS domain S-box-containing protein